MMFEMLFELLRRLDEGIDNIVFLDGKGSSRDFPIEWTLVLPAYFRTLADTTEPSEYAREVLRAIDDFASTHRAGLIADARQRAHRSQRLTLDRAIRRRERH